MAELRPTWIIIGAGIMLLGSAATAGILSRRFLTWMLPADQLERVLRRRVRGMVFGFTVAVLWGVAFIVIGVRGG